jgi:hypothetical protein
MFKPMPTRKMLIRNGMRQPQDISSWSGSFETRLKIATTANTPIGLPICTMLPTLGGHLGASPFGRAPNEKAARSWKTAPRSTTPASPER